MQRKIFFILLLFWASLNITHAQYREAPNALAFRAVAPNFAYPISNSMNGRDFTLGGEIEYIRHLASVLNFSLPVRFSEAKIYPNGGPAIDANKERIYALGADALLHLKFIKESFFLYPYLYGGIGATLEDWEKITYTAPVGASLNFRLARHWYLSTKAEYRFSVFQDHRDHLQFGAGLLVILGKGSDPASADRDMDGVRDLVDQCPDEAGTEATDGCPDTDLDGVADAFDNCPDLPGEVQFLGCPDSDGDGIYDPEDNCPNEAGLVANQGCPAADSDNDGFADDVDPCPDLPDFVNGCPDQDFDQIIDPEDACPTEFGPAETQGCPDRDRDGIPDAEDACPTEAAPGSADGCPTRTVTKEVEERLNYVARDVKFESGRSVLTAASYANLNEIFSILEQYPDYRMLIEGHTDNTGSASTNQRLSEERARTCYQYLINKGINASRLTYRGMGEDFPIADNSYASGREQNRRVEFELIPPR
jgi:outer membrane protein OmpA-like peptidoglycan-associated protein